MIEAFCRFCHLLYDRRLVSGVGGNVSLRHGNQFFLTPSGYSLRAVNPNVVVRVDMKGRVLQGPEPTKDAEMHLAILISRPHMNTVCHVHGAHIIAASSLLSPGPDTLPPLTPGFVHYAYPLPMLSFVPPGTKSLAEAVTKQLSREKCQAVLLQNHGLVAVGRDFEEAMNIAEEIDEAAQVYLLTKGKGTMIPVHDSSNVN